MANKAQQKENLEKVTDYVEEQQLDADKMAKAMSSLTGEDGMAAAEAAKAAREWMAVKVPAEDVDLIVNELEVPRDVAEMTLKQQGGNVVHALRRLLE